MRFFRWLKELLNKDLANAEQQEISKTIINRKTMARKTVISKVVEENAQDGVIEFPQNRTLYADQFTDAAPNTDEDREGFKNVYGKKLKNPPTFVRYIFLCNFVIVMRQ